MPEDFCVFVLSHGRPDRVHTVETLQKGGYSGPWFVVIDNEDAKAPEYVTRFGKERVLVFDKAAIAKTFDTADLSQDRRSVVFARNACFGLARQLGYAYFLELDDDYTVFQMRSAEEGRLLRFDVQNLDRLFSVMLEFLQSSGMTSVALSQGGDALGGSEGGNWRLKFLRKAMNTFFCRAADDWRFAGRLNEDVNVYTTLAHRGGLFLTTMYAMVVQQGTQSNAGGMTETYLNAGTYAKSFYTVMMCPSAVKVGRMGNVHERIHHSIHFNNCVPKIVSERHRKAVA